MRRPDEALHLIIDSTGLSIVGQGEWAAVKHGGRGRRGWKKLHLGVDRSGRIVAQALTDEYLDDATIGVALIDTVDGAISSVTADAAYDTLAVYGAAKARGATVVVPPKRTAVVARSTTAVGCSRAYDQQTERDRSPAVEEGVRIPSTGASGERLLPVQVAHW